MTIASTPSEISYAGDGVSVAFAIPFPFDTAADLKVISTDAEGNISVLTTGFSVSGGSGSTGTLTFGTAPAATVDITILDNPEIKQATDYVSNDPFPAKSHERALDRGVRISKRLYQLIQRCMHFSDGDPITDLTLGSVDNRKGKYLFFNAITGAIEYAANIVTTTLSQSIIGQLLNPQTDEEEAASALPLNYFKDEGDVERYATNTTPGTTDMTAAFRSAWKLKKPKAGAGPYLITGSIPIIANQQARLEGTVINITGTSVEVFVADAVNDWSMKGRFEVIGDNGDAGATTGNAVGLKIIDCMRFHVDAPIFKNIKGWGILVQPGASTSDRAEHGQIVAPQCYACYVGIEAQAGTGAEYVSIVAPNVSRCNTGVKVAAGNLNVLGGSITDNTDGVSIGSGTNHAHGSFVGTHINHNTVYAVRADSVTAGHNFIGCHIYEGDIYLKQSQGILFKSCTVDAKNYYFEGSQGCGFIDCALPAAYFVSIQDNFNANASYTIWQNCKKLTGKNDGGAGGNIKGIRVNATSGGVNIAAATLAAETTLLLADTSNQTAHNPVQTLFDGYAAGTGIYTCRGLGDGKVRVTAQLSIANNAADDMGSMYAYLQKNASGAERYFTRVKISATKTLFILDCIVEMNDTDNLRIKLGSTVTFANQITVSASETNVIVEGL